jgi:hypothetical protein
LTGKGVARRARCKPRRSVLLNQGKGRGLGTRRTAVGAGPRVRCLAPPPAPQRLPACSARRWDSAPARCLGGGDGWAALVERAGRVPVALFFCLRPLRLKHRPFLGLPSFLFSSLSPPPAALRVPPGLLVVNNRWPFWDVCILRAPGTRGSSGTFKLRQSPGELPDLTCSSPACPRAIELTSGGRD